MSASDIGPLEWIEQARGRSLTRIIVDGLGGYFLALSGSAIAGLTSVFDLLFLPFRLGIDIGEAAVQQLIVVPLGLTDFGFAISAMGSTPIWFTPMSIPRASGGVTKPRSLGSPYTIPCSGLRCGGTASSAVR